MDKNLQHTVYEVSDEMKDKIARRRVESNKSIEFGKWIGEKQEKDSWFNYDIRTHKWYVYMKGHVTTEELYDIFLSETRVR